VEGKAASAGTREEGRGNQTPAASRAATSIDDGEAAGGRPPAKNKDVRRSCDKKHDNDASMSTLYHRTINRRNNRSLWPGPVLDIRTG